MHMKNKNGLKNESKSYQKRKAILEAAARVFSNKGYIDSSIKNITDEASVAVGTFYTYFDNKEDVLEQIYEEISQRSLEIVEQSSIDKADSVVKKFTLGLASEVYFYAENKDLSKIMLLRSMGINESFEKKRWSILDRTNIYLRNLLKHLKEVHHADIYDVDVTSVLITQSIFGVMTYWLDDRFTEDLSTVIFNLCTYHLRALNIKFTDQEVNEYIKMVFAADNEEVYE